MALYESTFILRQDLTPQEVDKISDGFAKIVKDRNGKVVKREYWGLRNLAYKIKKGRKGHYVMFGIDSKSDAVDELSRQYRLSEDVIRDMTVRVEEISKEASALIRQGNSSSTKSEGQE